MASTTIAQPQDVGLDRLNIQSDSDGSEAVERKRPAVSTLALPKSIVDVATDNFLYWNLSDLIDEHPTDTSAELPTENELALEIAGVGLKVVKDKADPENEDHVPADRATKVDALVCLRKILVLHEGKCVFADDLCCSALLCATVCCHLLLSEALGPCDGELP
jgi:hypothetical protein